MSMIGMPGFFESWLQSLSPEESSQKMLRVRKAIHEEPKP